MYKYFAFSSPFMRSRTRTRPHLQIYLLFYKHRILCKGKARKDNLYWSAKAFVLTTGMYTAAVLHEKRYNKHLSPAKKSHKLLFVVLLRFE